MWNEFREVMTNRLGFEFVDITSNVRGTTFHTNHDNDTNPRSAFVTYRKPAGLRRAQRSRTSRLTLRSERQWLADEIVRCFAETGRRGLKFRAVQSELIELVHERGIDRVPDEKFIKQLLEDGGFRFDAKRDTWVRPPGDGEAG